MNAAWTALCVLLTGGSLIPVRTGRRTDSAIGAKGLSFVGAKRNTGPFACSGGLLFTHRFSLIFVRFLLHHEDPDEKIYETQLPGHLD